MAPECQIDFSVYFFLALALLILPLDWLAAAIFAGAFHELCHYWAMKALHIRCFGIRIGAVGTTMDTSEMDSKEELLVSTAGPLGSFLLLIFLRICPQLSICGFVQGCFNLLPIYPLDGGRILRCLIGERARTFEWICILTFLSLGLWLTCKFDLGLLPFGLCVLAAGKGFLRKIPCNADKLGVQ